MPAAHVQVVTAAELFNAPANRNRPAMEENCFIFMGGCGFDLSGILRENWR
jgi:hypothetical protein